MRSFEIVFYDRYQRMVNRTLFQGLRRGSAVAHARMLMSVRQSAASFQVEEI